MKRFAVAAVLALASLSANANLVVNGNFETGNFSGWTKSGNGSLSDVIANTVTSNHSNVWRSGATGSLAYISQDVATIAGTTYSFAYDVYNTATSNSIFEVYFGGHLVGGFTNSVQNWTHFEIDNLVATGSTTTIKFGARNDPSFTRLDNVTLDAVNTATSVPEPASIALLLGGLGLLACARRRAA